MAAFEFTILRELKENVLTTASESVPRLTLPAPPTPTPWLSVPDTIGASTDGRTKWVRHIISMKHVLVCRQDIAH